MNTFKVFCSKSIHVTRLSTFQKIRRDNIVSSGNKIGCPLIELILVATVCMIRKNLFIYLHSSLMPEV